MTIKRCKFCGNVFKPGGHMGADQEYCNRTHRSYENTYQWLRKLKNKRKYREAVNRKIEKAVHLTVKQYGPALKKLAKQ